MSDDDRSTSESAADPGSDRDDALQSPDPRLSSPRTTGLTILLWAFVSMGLLAYVALGSTPAFIWRFGRKHRELKSILRTWTIEADNLPRVGQQWLLDGAFYAALIVFLVGAIAGVWLLLSARDVTDLSPGTEAESKPVATSVYAGSPKG